MPGAPYAKSSFPLAGYSLDLASRPPFFKYFCVLTIILFQSLIARSREKSWLLHEQKENWDRLVEEARLHGDVAVQLAPLVEEVDSLRLQEPKAHWHEEETERAFEALSVRARQDEEEVARVRREWDELL